MTTTKMSNSVARKHFLHDNDFHNDEVRCCYFAQRPYDESGWGFWVRPDGTVDTDDTSANGEMPSCRTVEACQRAAIKHLNR